jgi:hypothetical protein
MAGQSTVERDLAQVARWLESMDGAADAPEVQRLEAVARGIAVQAARTDTIDTDYTIEERARALVDEVQALMLARLDAVRRVGRRVGRGARGR